MDVVYSMHGRYKKCNKILVGKPEGKEHLGDLGVGERITLRWTLGR